MAVPTLPGTNLLVPEAFIERLRKSGILEDPKRIREFRFDTRPNHIPTVTVEYELDDRFFESEPEPAVNVTVMGTVTEEQLEKTVRRIVNTMRREERLRGGRP